MLSSYQRGDDAAFRTAASEVIEEERRKHHELLATELEGIMAARSNPQPERLKVASLRPLPKGRNDAELVELVNPRRTLEEQTLRPDVRARLDEILIEHQKASTLRAHGLAPARALLFVGPPGTGKTTSAEAVAAELGVPLARVIIPTVVSSLLGETSRNLAAIFEACRSEPWVVLFDEFDALGKERADATEHGELKRVVTTFLQLLDVYAGPAVVIAATNHPAMLDEAVWRRFDEVLGFRLPTQKEIERQVRRQFRRVRLDAGPHAVAQMLKGASQADVEMVCRTAMKRAVLRDAASVTVADIQASIGRLEERRAIIRRSQA